MQQRWSVFFCCLSFVFLSFAKVGFAQVLTPRYSSIAANVPLETALLQKTNEVRESHGFGKLSYDEGLALAARHHAREMATLGYFSHQSPEPLNATPSKRVARAGAAIVSIGENIAQVPGPDIVDQAIDGWMNSPGHRANLLTAEFSHVGFGLASDGRGQTLVVQVLGFQPFKLTSAKLESKQQTVYEITMQVSLPQAANVIFSYGQQNTESQFLEAGTHNLRHLSAETGQVFLQASVLAETGGAYIIQDSGWLTLPSSNYSPDALTAKTYIRILGARSVIQTIPIYEVTLSFSELGSRQLAVFLNQAYQPQALIRTETLKLAIPQTLANPEIAIGEIDAPGHVSITMLLTIDQSRGLLELVPKAVE